LPRAEILIWAAKLFTKRNFIITRHNAEPFVPFLPIQISSWLSRILIAKGRSTIAISDSVKRYLQKEGEVDSDADISIIKYCYDPTVKRLRPKTLGSSDIVTKFVSVARLEKQKNLEVLLAGFSKYRTRYGAGTLDIFGSGSEREKLVEMCKSLGIDSYVEFRGKVNDIPSTISRYQCFLLTSKYEGFGLVLLEAMQCGLPIICSDAEALVEVVGSQYEGFFKIGEDEQLFHQMTLINNSETYNERAEYCSGRLEYFSPTKTLNDLLYVYLRNKSASKD
jgi:glycosyltransferase involved in cell wall biosynthesis